MAHLTKAFKAVGTIVGEAVIAGAGILAIYGIGWVHGARNGSEVIEAIDNGINKLCSDEVPEDNEEPVTEEYSETVPPIEVVQNQPED